MDVTPLIHIDLNIIQSYKDDVIKVQGQYYKAPIIVTAQHIFDIGNDVFDMNNPDGFLFLKDNGVHILLRAHRDGFMPLSPLIQQAFRDHGLTMDVMDYGAAARTYNVLATEGRPVAVIFV